MAPSGDDIARQQELLAAHRQTLAVFLTQQAQQGGSAFAQPAVANGIREARAEIRRVKAVLRGWGAAVADHPDDAAGAQEDSPASSAPRSLRVFLSYKRDVAPDEPLAQQLVAALRVQHEVFIDQDLPVGARWAERIKDELARSDALITLLSAQAVQSEMLKEEIANAHALAQTQAGRPAILPVRVAYREPFTYPLNAYLNGINWAVWDTEADTPTLIAALLRALSGGALPLSAEADKAALLQHHPPPLAPPPAFAQPPRAPRAVAALELPEGTMDPGSAFYVERPADPLALETIRRPGVTLTIKGPRQMGKSSLLIRAMAAAVEAGKQVAFLDFQLFDRAALASADTFFRQFCTWLSDTLDLDDRTADYWAAPLGNSQRCTRYLSRYVLAETAGPLVLAMDEVESIFDTAFRSDFFGMLRSWHNSRATSPAWKRLDLALVTSTEPYQLIANLNQSPFNVGQVLDLEDFTPAQVADLNQRHGAPLDDAGVARLITLLGGHPYLVRRALYLLAGGQRDAADLFAHATGDRGPFGDHLRYHLFRLHDRPELIHGLLQVIRAQTCDDERVFFRLRGAGLVRREGRAALPRCQLYADYFRERLKP